MQVEPNAMPTITEIAADLQRQRFYGSVEFKFEAGHVVLIRKTESFKPKPEGYRINRGVNEPTQSK